MPRPVKCRRIDAMPEVTYFKPRGVPLRQLNEIYLTVDGFEALRLADHEGLHHSEAAKQMAVSRQTFGRILAQARATVAKALVSGMALCIHGGEFTVDPNAVENAAIAPEEEESMDKIAITSEGPTLDDQLDPRFGRAAGFIIVDPQTMNFEYVDNGTSQTLAQGAGIQAAENVVRTGAKAVLTGYVGPKAFMALERAGIKVAQNLENMNIRQAIDQYQNGNLAWAQAPNRRGHGR